MSKVYSVNTLNPTNISILILNYHINLIEYDGQFIIFLDI